MTALFLIRPVTQPRFQIGAEPMADRGAAVDNPRSAGLQCRCGAAGQKSEPVPEDFGRRGLGRDIATKPEARQLGAQRQLALSGRSLLKAGKPALGLDVEIPGR